MKTLAKPLMLMALCAMTLGGRALAAMPRLTDPSTCAVELIVLGAGQDAGAPQIGNPDDPAWKDPARRLFATSLGLVDRRTDQRYLFDATPDIREQVQLLDQVYKAKRPNLGLHGIFLTHAHIGHYVGLIMLGREAANTAGLPVFAAPRMASFLRENGPWSQLVAIGNINLLASPPGSTTRLSDDVSVSSMRVPHRDELSETVGYLIKAGARSALFIPDIDDWDEWKAEYGVDIKALVASVDAAFLDATFFDDKELPGRDMSAIPHPRVSETMDRFADLPDNVRARVHFIHYNHTNKIRFPASSQSQQVVARGHHIARRGDRFCLIE